MLDSSCAGANSPPWRHLTPLSTPIVDRHLRQILDQAVARVFGIAGHELWIATRGSPRAAGARQAAMYLAHVGFGLNLARVGRLFGRDRKTVAHACDRIEERRADAVLDRALEVLEGVARLFSPLPA